MNKGIVLGIVFMFVVMSFTSISSIQIDKDIIIPSGRGDILYVGGSGEGNYTTIQGAIDDASDGDTVFVFDDSSPYYENLIVDKSINLIGEDRDTTVIDGNNYNYVIYIKESTDRVNISGFTIKNTDTGIMGEHFLSNITIFDNHFLRCSGGIHLWFTDDSYINSNIFNNCNSSIYWGYSKNNRISNNIIINSSAEFYQDIVCGEGSNYVITNNKCINYNKEIDKIGINLGNISDSIIENNEFNGYDYIAILLFLGDENNLISHNNILNNDCGIYIGIFSGSNKIINNNFINNSRDVQLVPNLFKNYWDSNYWDEWIGLKFPILSFLPYFSYSFLSFLIDWHPAKEPYNYTTTQGCGME